MKKSFLIVSTAVLALFAGSNAYAQNYKQSGKTPDELYTGTLKVVSTVAGDINKDGVNDLIVCAENKDNAIYFGSANGVYHLYKLCPLPEDNAKITINDKGVVRIQMDVYQGSDVFLYRYENNCLRLIGGKKDRHKTDEDYDISFNYLTAKMIKTKGTGKTKTAETIDMHNLPVLRLGWFPMRYDMLDYLFNLTDDGADASAEFKEAFGIFRLMQDRNFLFGFFNDYENNFHDLRDFDNSVYEAEFITERPGVYNHYATVNLKKQRDDTYLISMQDSHQDRAYEHEVNAYYNEHPDTELDFSEILEQLGVEFSEGETTSEKYIFKDGEFIEQK